MCQNPNQQEAIIVYAICEYWLSYRIKLMCASQRGKKIFFLIRRSRFAEVEIYFYKFFSTFLRTSWHKQIAQILMSTLFENIS